MNFSVFPAMKSLSKIKIKKKKDEKRSKTSKTSKAIMFKAIPIKAKYIFNFSA